MSEVNVVTNMVPQILSFGAIGLAFLMAYFAFRLVKTVAAQESPDPQTINLTRFYMVITLALLLSGCFLQIYTQNNPVEVNLIITPDLREEMSPRVLVDVQDIKLTRQTALLRLGRGTQINLQMDPLVEHIRNLESLGSATLQRQAELNPAIGATDDI